MKRTPIIDDIWLEVSNIALNEGEAGGVRPPGTADPTVFIDIQLKGDWEDDRWLIFKGSVEKFKPLMEAMKEKRPIHAKLAVKKGKLGITELRVSFAASSGRT